MEMFNSFFSPTGNHGQYTTIKRDGMTSIFSSTKINCYGPDGKKIEKNDEETIREVESILHSCLPQILASANNGNKSTTINLTNGRPTCCTSYQPVDYKTLPTPIPTPPMSRSPSPTPRKEEPSKWEHNYWDSHWEKETEELKRTSDINVTVQFSLKRMYTNKKKRINVKVKRQCRCLFSGCKDCKGTSQKTVKQRIDVVPVREKTYTFKGTADQKFNHTPGDIILNVISESHPHFRIRDRVHLETYATITLFQAIFGCKITITHLDGEEISFRIKKYKPFHKIKGKGLKHDKDTEERGHLFVVLQIHEPSNLEECKKHKQLLKQLLN
jgi:hypothetical protein